MRLSGDGKDTLFWKGMGLSPLSMMIYRYIVMFQCLRLTCCGGGVAMEVASTPICMEGEEKPRECCFVRDKIVLHVNVF